MPDQSPTALAAIMEAGGSDVLSFALPGGETLFEAGENTAMIYVVRAGRLAAIHRDVGREPRWLGVIGPGEPIGEIALLADSPHTATVVALRDCELLAMPRAAFMAVFEAHPGVAREMARLLIRRARGDPELSQDARVFGFLGMGSDVDVRAMVEALTAEIARLGFTAVVLGGAEIGRETAWFSRIEEEHSYVFYAAEANESAWAAACGRQVDRLFLVGRGDHPPPPELPPHLRLASRPFKPVDLVLTHSPSAGKPRGASAWRERVPAQRLLHVRDRHAGDVARLVRVLTGRSTGLVLSGGGARGYAHIGAVRALRQAGAPLDFIGGTSMGAVIGASVAMDWDDAEIERRVRKAFVDSNPLGDIAFPRLAMTRGLRVAERLAEHFGADDISDLWRPFFCVSSDLTAGSHHIHDQGSITQALRATIALPGVLPPITLGETVLVDGGVLRNLPTDLMRAVHAGPIIAVDVGGGDAGLSASDLATPASLWKWFLSGAWRRGAPIVSLLMRSATVTAVRERAAARQAADLFIAPALKGVEIRDWKAFPSAVAAGYQATVEALAGLDRPVTELRNREWRSP
jgi:NTE family protein